MSLEASLAMSLDQVSTNLLQASFSSFDINGDLTLDQTEFNALCHKMGSHFSPKQKEEAYQFLGGDTKGTKGNKGRITWQSFLQWFDTTNDKTETTPVALAMNKLRNSVSQHSNLFFGLTFDDWKNAPTLLDPTEVFSWSTTDVLLSMATSPQLQVCRSYLNREHFTDVDGETLLALTKPDLLDKGIKPYHINKFLRYTSSLRFAAQHPHHALHANPDARRKSLSAQRTAKTTKTTKTSRTTKGRHHLPPVPHPATSNGTVGTIKRTPPTGVRPPPQRRPSPSPSPSPSLISSPSTLSSNNQDEIGINWKKGHMIGRGSYGAVYMVLNETNGRFMAMKEVELGYGSSDAEEVQALVTEISLLKALQHPNIVRYLGSRISMKGTASILIFTEWVPGGSIRSILDNFGPLSVNVVRSYVHQALEGLLYLHDHHIWHRDIKGANILVTDSGKVRLADFGTSESLKKEEQEEQEAEQEAQEGTTTTNTTTSNKAHVTCGTPLFMAPEAMLDPANVDGLKADIWSMGATTLQMATGHPPWRERQFSNFMQLMMFVAKDDGITPNIDETLPPALRDFIGMCFRRDPPVRPSARQLLTHPFFGKHNHRSSLHSTNSVHSVHSVHSSGTAKQRGGSVVALKPLLQTAPPPAVLDGSPLTPRNVVMLPPLSVDVQHEEEEPSEMNNSFSSRAASLDEEEGQHYYKIQSYLEESARDSHSDFHRASSMEEAVADVDHGNNNGNNIRYENEFENPSLDNDAGAVLHQNMLGTGDLNQMLEETTVAVGTNPFASGENEELTSTLIQQKISVEAS